MEPIFLEPVLQEKIWGGNQLLLQFGLEIPSEQTGEAWLVSAHPNGRSKVIAPKQFAGLTLDQLYTQEPELFGTHHPEPFPLLTKIIDAREDLSVQVHPDDDYAKIHEGPNEYGKTECWYIIDAQPGASIIYGHTAQSKEEFKAQIEAGHWDDLLTRVPVQTGDFYYVPHGTVHAIGRGIVLMEIQQSSDTTYRLYDYDRRDSDGNLRPLHLEDSIAVTNYPQSEIPQEIIEKPQAHGSITHYLTNEYFTVEKWDTKETLTIPLTHEYALATVITGEGELVVHDTSYPLHLATTFILPTDIKEVTIRGDLEIIVAYPEFGDQS